MRRAVLLGLLFISLALASAGISEWSAGRRAIEDSDKALALGKVHDATVLARRAAEAAVPGSPYASLGYRRLEAIAQAAETQGKLADAAFAWRAMRSAAEATWPAPAGRGRVDEADAGIRRVAAAPTPVRPGNITPPSPWLPSLLGWALLVTLAASAHRLLGSSVRRNPA